MLTHLFIQVHLLSLADTAVTAVANATVDGAFNGVAKLFAGFLSGILAFVLVVEGYMYLSSMDDIQKAAHAKRAIGAAIAGAVMVTVATGIAPQIVQAFGK